MLNEGKKTQNTTICYYKIPFIWNDWMWQNYEDNKSVVSWSLGRWRIVAAKGGKETFG